MGMPPAIALPMVTASGRRPRARVQPPTPALIVCVSSLTSSVPVSSQSSRTFSRKPACGGTMPMLVIHGSMSTQATSRGASAAPSASTSLNSTTLVVCVGSTCGPTLPGLAIGSPSGPTTMIVSSTVPW